MTYAEQITATMQPWLKPVSPGVFYADGGFTAVDRSTLSFLKERALTAPNRRARLCLHADPDAIQHDMLIVMHHSSYVAPHCHFGKSETLALIEGACDAIVFDDAGQVLRIVTMRADTQEGCFLYRMPASLFHTLHFKSEWTVFTESTVGPFSRRDTRVASWAPPETDPVAGLRYVNELTKSRV